nr:hypothetical protein [Tanacetum cinerariifolium]
MLGIASVACKVVKSVMLNLLESLEEPKPTIAHYHELSVASFASTNVLIDLFGMDIPVRDPEDDHADYLADGADGEDEPSNNDDDDDTDDEDEEPFKDEEDDEEEEEEHLTLADSFDVPIVDLVLPAGDTKALEAYEPAP